MEPFKQRRNSQQSQLRSTKRRGDGHALTFAFPAAKAPKTPYSHLLPRTSSCFLLQAPASYHDVRPDVRFSLSFLELQSDPGKAGCTQRCCVSSRLIMAQVSRYRASTITSVLLSGLTQRQQVEHQLAVLLKHLSCVKGVGGWRAFGVINPNVWQRNGIDKSSC